MKRKIENVLVRRFMIEKLIEDLLALKDAVLLEESCLLEEEDFV